MKTTTRLSLYKIFQFLTAAYAALALHGCAYIFYSETPKNGTFSGKLYVEWIAPNEFIYSPDKDNPLTFITSEGDKITPQRMYTDGGSIPRLFWSAKNLGPWDFAPGFIIHDWLFEQHRCKKGDWKDYDLNSAAKVLAEAMKAQMEKHGKPEPVVAYAVYRAVQSQVAEKSWNEGDCRRVQGTPKSRDIEVLTNGKQTAPLRVFTINGDDAN